jgi:hypothetical protein
VQAACHESRFVVLILRRLLKRLRAAWPQVSVELRADSGFAVPRLYAWCEANGLTYTISMIPNRRLVVIAAPLLSDALTQSTGRRWSQGPTGRRHDLSSSNLGPPPPVDLRHTLVWLGHAQRRPVLQRLDDRVSDQLLGQIEIAEEVDQARGAGQSPPKTPVPEARTGACPA